AAGKRARPLQGQFAARGHSPPAGVGGKAPGFGTIYRADAADCSVDAGQHNVTVWYSFVATTVSAGPVSSSSDGGRLAPPRSFFRPVPMLLRSCFMDRSSITRKGRGENVRPRAPGAEQECPAYPGRLAKGVTCWARVAAAYSGLLSCTRKV